MQSPSRTDELDVESARRAPPCVLVIFGASGDLTARKLLPALERLAAYDRLAPEFALVGVARTPMTDDEFAERCGGRPRWPAATGGAELVDVGPLRAAAATTTRRPTHRLAEVLDECDRTRGTAGNRVYYLATPPRLFGTIAVQSRQGRAERRPRATASSGS